ncbi:MAG: hypothetical protein J5476_12880 [Lachnospiraceae bacterium]|nr:hypothetical protein [Lachnospiraceae bacterium]
MITLFFVILMFIVIGKLLHLAIKLAWGMTKIVCAVVFFPIILIGLAIAGFIYLAILILIVVGILSLFTGLIFG